MTTAAVTLEHIGVRFGDKEVLKRVDWSVPKHKISSLIGPNGCGKSTVLKVVTGNLVPTAGTVEVEGKAPRAYASTDLARLMAFLPQTPEAPGDMSVEELVYCGRFPHRKWWKNSAREDRIAVESAFDATKTMHLRERYVSSLSGGERQRVWIAMALAQEPEVLVLDEPTTYLDINHQLEILELLTELNETKHITVLMVLHELNQAIRYSHEIAVLFEGNVHAAGKPADVVTRELLADVFRVDTDVAREDGIPYIHIKGLRRES